MILMRAAGDFEEARTTEDEHSARPSVRCISDGISDGTDRMMWQQSSVEGPHVQSFNRLALAGTVPAI